MFNYNNFWDNYYEERLAQAKLKEPLSEDGFDDNQDINSNEDSDE